MSALPRVPRLTTRRCLCWLLLASGCLASRAGPLVGAARPGDGGAPLVVVAAAATATAAGSEERAQQQQQQRRQRAEEAPGERARARDERSGPAQRLGKRAAAHPAGAELEGYDEPPEDDLEDEYVELNVTAEKWKYLGSPCDLTCNPMLQHVHCDPQSKFCECEKQYPVQLGPTKGCAKPKKLGEQCLYRATCLYTDQHSTCTQVQHNAVCECEAGYHRVGLSRSNKKLFCGADLVLIATDLPTLLGVAAGIAVITGLICFVLKLFSRARYTRPRHYANAGHPPPMLFSSDTGIPLALHGGRPSSRSSQRSSSGTIAGCAFPRKQSGGGGGGGGGGVGDGGGFGGGARGPLVPGSRAGAARAAAILLISCHRQATTTNNGGGNKHRRALSDVAEGSSDGLGSRRPSLASLHSSTSSAKSYSARRLERERNEKEHRQALVELKLKHREQQQQQQQQRQQQVAPTPSPRTPHSTDELLPSVAEATEIFYNEISTKSRYAGNAAATSSASGAMANTTTTTIAAANEAASLLFESDAKPCTSTGIYSS